MVPPTYLSHRLRGLDDVLRALVSKLSLMRLTTMGVIGYPMAALPIAHNICLAKKTPVG